MNVMQMEKGRDRWSMIADNVWDMILGKSGKLPGPLSPYIIELASKQGREFFSGNPQDLYPDSLDTFKKEMDEKDWDYGQDDDELMELAMHPEQYRNYKSGKAKTDFMADLAKRKAAKKAAAAALNGTSANSNGNATHYQPKKLNIDVNGEKYVVSVSYDEADMNQTTFNGSEQKTQSSDQSSSSYPDAKEILAPLEGVFYLTKESSDTPVKVGDSIKEGDIIGYIESMKVYNAISADQSGKVVEISIENGASIEEDDVLIKVV